MAEVTIIREFNEQLTKDIIDLKASTFEGIRACCETLAKIANAALKSGNNAPTVEIKTDKGDGVALAGDLIDKFVDKYNNLARTECYKALKESGNAVVNACKQMQYDVIKKTEKKVGEKNAKVSQVSIIDSKKNIDLRQLEKFCGGNIMVDTQWYDRLQWYSAVVLMRVGTDIGWKPEKIADCVGTYAMSEVAREIGNGKTPTSNTQMLKELQAFVKETIGDEYKANSHHVQFSLYAGTKQAPTPNAIKFLSPNAMCNVMLGLMHTIITGEDFDGVYKQIKNG